MNITCSELYETQLKEILDSIISEQDYKAAKDFKLYLDTIILNMPTKVKKYKTSVYFDDENIKDIEYHEYTVPFIANEQSGTYVVLGIVKK